jgi:HK97 gp10 family phage protein
MSSCSLCASNVSDGFRVELKGLREVDEKLAQLDKVAGEKVMRSVMFAAMKPAMVAAKANAAALPTGSGALEKSIRRVYLKQPQSNRFVVSVGPKAKDRTAIALANLHYKRRRGIRGIYWGHFVEFGTKRRDGSNTPARSVFGRALTSTASQVIREFDARIRQRVDKAITQKGEP